MSARLATADPVELPVSQDIAGYLGPDGRDLSRTATQLASEHCCWQTAPPTPDNG